MSEDTREDMSGTPRVEVTETPGQRLRRARETAGLEVARVATELRLETRTIEALEQDRFERLPPPIFVRGYLRAYGDLLELPVDELLEAHARLQPEEEPPLVAGRPVERGPGTGRTGLRLIVLVLLLLAVIGALVWWFGSSAGHALPGVGGSRGHAGQPAHADKAGAAKAAVARKMAVRHLTAPAAGAAGAAAGSAPLPEAAPRQPAPDSAGHADGATRGGPQPGTAPGATQSGAQPGVAGSDGDGAPDKSAADNSTGDPIPPSRRVRLALTFRQKCWVEVHDARQKRLLYTLVPAGHRRTVVAEAPVHVFLGNAPGVKVTVNGQRYPTASYTRPNNTARFVLKSR